MMSTAGALQHLVQASGTGSKMSYLYDRVEDKYALIGGALCAGCTNERGQVQAWKLCQGLDVDSEGSRDRRTFSQSKFKVIITGRVA